MKRHSIISALCVLAAGFAGAQTTFTIYDAGVGPATDPLLDEGWGTWDSNAGTPLDLNASASTTTSGAAAWEFGDDLLGANGTQGDALYYDIDAVTALEMATSTTGFTIDIEIESVGSGGYISLGDSSNILGGGATQRYGATPGVTENPPGVETLTFTYPSGGPLSYNFGSGSASRGGEWVGPAGTLRLNLADNTSGSSAMHFKLVSLKLTYTPGGSPPEPDFAIGGDTSGGTPDVTDTANWTTNSVAYIQDAMVGVDDGYILDWENVTQTAVVDAPNGEFDSSAVGGPNYTNGILYMYTAESVDIGALANGITRLGISGTFTSSTLNNWIPVMAITEGGVTRYYRSSNTGNSWNGAGSLNVFFNSLGTVSNTDFAGLRPADETTTHIDATRDLDTTPVLHPEYVWDFDAQQYNLEGAPTGIATFGFIQWGASGAGSVDQPAFSTTVQTFEVNGFSDADDIVQPPNPQGLAATGVDSSTFLYQYEMDEDPATQDLDGNGTVDWRPYGGVPNFNTIQTFMNGVGFSNQAPFAPAPDLEDVIVSVSGDDIILDWVLSADAAVDVEGTDELDLGFSLLTTVDSGITTFTDMGVRAFSDEYFYKLIPLDTIGVPENLIRNDDDGSIFRESLVGSDFTMEVRARVIGPLDEGNVGILGLAIDPGGTASALRMQVNLADVSQNASGADLIDTGANDDAMHTYRIAYIYADDFYFVWRDGVMIYGDNTDIGIVGSNGGFNDAGTTWVGDFSSSLSGEWEVDYIRFHDSAVGP